MSKKLKVAELFAGVGGFRLGLEKNDFEVVWSNQWEPSTKMQHASLVYEARFGSEGHTNENIETVETELIPDIDLLCGGFPCQDYSVATTLHNSKGLKGKKGVLWWSIERILREKKSKKPKYLFLENVDRLLKSPATQRGRDFAVMLKSLDELGYAVEWRVINAAEYGMPQRRRRVFFLGYHKSTPLYKAMKKAKAEKWVQDSGVMAQAFPIKNLESINEFEINGNLVEVTNNFGKGDKVSKFQNTGMMVNGKVYSTKSEPKYSGKKIVLKDIIQVNDVPSEFFISNKKLKHPKTIISDKGRKKTIRTEKDMWKYLKGAKKEKRTTNLGYTYRYAEGSMKFPEDLENASRTIITGEGGVSPSRFKHVINQKNKLRRLTPIELERLNMFPDNHTQLKGITNTKRAFFMGNALVVGVVEKVSKILEKEIKEQ